MNEPQPPPISAADWDATPESIRALVLFLRARIALLEARLNQHSGNSSKPPSSDPPSAPPRPHQNATGSHGGQPGHPGHIRPLVPSEQVDALFLAWHAYRNELFDRAGLQQALIPVRTALRELLKQGRTIAWYRIQGFSGELLAHWDALWIFSTIDGVEPTNNAAERALRPAVLWRKGCFGTQSATGSRFVERMLTVTATCAQQRRNLFTFLTEAVRAAWMGQPTPTLVSVP